MPGDESKCYNQSCKTSRTDETLFHDAERLHRMLSKDTKTVPSIASIFIGGSLTLCYLCL